MIILIASWTGLLLLFLATGCLVQRLIGFGKDSPRDWFLAFWLGWAVILALIQLINFVIPVIPGAWILSAGFAAIGGAVAWRRRGKITGRISLTHVVVLCLWIVLGAYLALQAMEPISTVDTAKYHLGAVKWATEYPAVPGIGNLIHALGSSSAYYLYAALVNIGPLHDKSYLVVNGLLLWVLTGQSLAQIAKLATDRSRPSPYQVYYALIFAPALLILISGLFQSVSPNAGAYFLGIVVGGEFLRWLDESSTERNHFSQLLAITLLASLGIAVRQTFVVFGGATILIAFLAWWASARKREWGRVIAVPAVCAFVLAPAIARTALFTGYLAFPAPLGQLPVEWRMPPQVVSANWQWIQFDARRPALSREEELRTVAWFGNWLRALIKPALEIAFLSVLLGGLMTTEALAGRKDRKRSRLLLFPIPSLVGLVFWFVSAPDYRYAGALFWILGTGMIVLFAEWEGWAERQWGQGLALVVAALFFVWLHPIRQIPSLGPGTMLSLPPAPPSPSFDRVPIGEGLFFTVPRKGEYCWNAPVPCSEDYSPAIQLIDPRDLVRGFKTSRQP